MILRVMINYRHVLEMFGMAWGGCFSQICNILKLLGVVVYLLLYCRFFKICNILFFLNSLFFLLLLYCRFFKICNMLFFLILFFFIILQIFQNLQYIVFLEFSFFIIIILQIFQNLQYIVFLEFSFFL